jgi:hypothetical protein
MIAQFSMFPRDYISEKNPFGLRMVSIANCFHGLPHPPPLSLVKKHEAFYLLHIWTCLFQAMEHELLNELRTVIL